MKTITKIFGLILLLNLFSCTSFLQFEPENVILTEDALQTPDDLQRTLVSCYDVLRSGKFQGGQSWLLSEFMADHLSGKDLSGDWLAWYNRSTGIFNSGNRGMWSEAYIMIYRANLLMESFDLISGLSDEDRNRIRGEALFLRAIGHFETVRFYGQPYGYSSGNTQLGIPIRTETGADALPRNTVGEVYDQILADLTEAVNLVPESNGVYANKWAVKGYLAEVYFMMNDFTNAYAMADDVLSNGPYTLDSTLADRFVPGASKEMVFELVSTGTADNSGGTTMGYYRSEFNRPTVLISKEAYTLFTLDTADARMGWVTIANEGAANEEYYATKFNGLSFMNVPMVYVSALKLIRAESAAELGNTATAVADLNDIRGRAGVALIATNTSAADLITFVRNERRLELFLEGDRLWDLKRQAIADSPGLTIRNAPWDCNGLVAQIPDEESAASSIIVPNPEGGCN
ncbi:MAG: RagB/SusD family nutrient uptake outer membrane protein [Bacteroidia bacterium]|nr:RagB/SusD family nutrient uptake outer membrane protein [Bacteroidia bacterium]